MALSTKRKQAPSDDSSLSPTPNKMQKTLTYTANTSVKRTPADSIPPIPSPPGTHHETTTNTDMAPQLALIAASTKTKFQKRVLSLLCQVPRGSVTTYGLMAQHLGSSPRAIGNVMRRNPFAPQVPCHRVVAKGGGLGGFEGAWPTSGESLAPSKKRSLLMREGVRFDGAGRVVDTPFCAFI